MSPREPVWEELTSCSRLLARRRYGRVMRVLSWWLAITVLGLVGTAVALLAGFGVTPQATVVISLGLVPLSVLALAFAGFARTSAIASYALVTAVTLGAPVADLWFRSVAAGNIDDASWLGLTCSAAITIAGAAATLLAGPHARAQSRSTTNAFA